jgi:hypothetical protein
VQLAGLDLRDVEDVVDDRQQMGAGMADRARRSCWPASRRLRSSSRAWPRMAFIGVRISWLMLARKALLARLAASARWLASASWAVRSATSSSRW